MRPHADSNEIRLTRVYNAPVARVWAAWADVDQIGHWWGPRGFTITTHSKDLRAGGTWSYTMHGPDGTDWPNFTRYHEVQPEALLVYDHGATSADAAPLFRMTVHFRDLGGTTELEIIMALATPEAAEQTRGFIKAAGGNATWDRLAEYVERQLSAQEIFVITRSFDAPIETLFDMWSDPAHVAAWLPPTGFTMAFDRAEIRRGGDAFYHMTNGAVTIHGRMQYLNVRRPDRLQYTQVFTDEHGQISRHPGAPTWPETMLTTVTLTAEGPSETRVTVQWAVHGSATAEEVAAFVAERGGMTQGWTGSFDSLDARLASHAAARS
jgi:uncharacterized protein YndB with AHSA1/START domain